ncbi:MAG: metal-dependent hydrolase [Chloroflexi bacterium]|nr:metal-dependent hydrolase [Chloroflexota bacterium]
MDFIGPVALTLVAAISARWAWNFLMGRRRLNARKSATARTGPTGQLFDLRFVLAGALIPDLIDKPLGFWIAPEFVNHSLRSVGHSLVFAVVVTASTLAVTRFKSWWPALSIGFGLAAHYAFDSMWLMPRTFLYPALGLQFEEGTVPFSWWWHRHFAHVTADPGTLVGIGASGLLVLWAIRAQLKRPRKAAVR